MTADQDLLPACGRVYFGSPTRPGLLRDLLQAKVDAMPAGGEIAWATYYFRDEALARSLVAARRRGVNVRVAIEGRPREQSANNRIIRFLGDAAGLGKGCRSATRRLPNALACRVPRFHEKIYYFSDPYPHALIGSFNPSGSEVEDPAIIERIGDQDRGHNCLVEVVHPRLASALHNRAYEMHHGSGQLWRLFLPKRQDMLAAGATQVYFFPMLGRSPVEKELASLSSGSTLRIATSHFNDKAVLKLIMNLAGNGVSVAILAHDTHRRVPRKIENALQGDNGIDFLRYRHPQRLPMHSKFLLIDQGGRKRVMFGSLNLSRRSLRVNREVLAVTEQTDIYSRFEDCWQEMWLEGLGFFRNLSHAG